MPEGRKRQDVLDQTLSGQWAGNGFSKDRLGSGEVCPVSESVEVLFENWQPNDVLLVLLKPVVKQKEPNKMNRVIL